ncbi:MAG: ubiquinol-cytochrome C chaperone family protein [Beijerinckiaceae bacterium]
MFAQILSLFRRSPNQPLIDRLHGEIMAAARQPVLFTDYGAADTVAGRFEVLCLAAAVAVGRIGALPEPGPAIAQDVTDALFRHLDVALREIGVGDVSVPKKMKTLAQGYLGRVAAYAGPLEAGDAEALAAAIARNVFGDAGRAQDAQAQRMARYALSWRAELAGLTVERLLAEPLPQRDARAVS